MIEIIVPKGGRFRKDEKPKPEGSKEMADRWRRKNRALWTQDPQKGFRECKNEPSGEVVKAAEKMYGEYRKGHIRPV